MVKTEGGEPPVCYTGIALGKTKGGESQGITLGIALGIALGKTEGGESQGITLGIALG